MNRTRRWFAAGPVALGPLAVAVLFAAVGCSGSGSSAAKTTTTAATATTAKTSTTIGPGAGRTVVVGSTGSAEMNVVMELYAETLESLGFTVTRRTDLAGREGEYDAIEKGDVALVPASTLSLLAHLTKGEPTTATVVAQLVAIKSDLPEKLTVLRPSYAESKQVIVCNATVASRRNLQKIIDLIPNAVDLVMGGPKEFADRKPFGLAGLKEMGVTFKAFTTLDAAGPATVAALKAGTVDCAVLVSTDPAIKTNKFVVLFDGQLAPADAVLPYAAKDLVADQRVVAAFDTLAAKLDTLQLTALVREVVVNNSSLADVAKQWLRATGVVHR